MVLNMLVGPSTDDVNSIADETFANLLPTSENNLFECNSSKLMQSLLTYSTGKREISFSPLILRMLSAWYNKNVRGVNLQSIPSNNLNNPLCKRVKCSHWL